MFTLLKAKKADLTYFYNLINKHLVSLTHNSYSLVLVKSILIQRNDQNGHYFPCFSSLKNQVEKSIIQIMDSRYGNYVVHTILDNWEECEMKSVLTEIMMETVALSKSKYSSNAIENCIMKDRTGRFVEHFIRLLNDKSILKGKFIILIFQNLYAMFTLNLL